MSSPPWPNREAVDASEDANDETDPGGMNGDATDDGTGEDGDVKKEGPAAAEVDEEGGGDAEAPGAEADMRWWCAAAADDEDDDGDDGEKEG